ncbi:hypothetical protein GCM10009642_08650 [Nocardiopsis metallicus]
MNAGYSLSTPVLFGGEFSCRFEPVGKGPGEGEKCHVRLVCEISCPGHILRSLERGERVLRGRPGPPGGVAEAKITESGPPRASPGDQGEGTLMTGH